MRSVTPRTKEIYRGLALFAAASSIAILAGSVTITPAWGRDARETREAREIRENRETREAREIRERRIERQREAERRQRHPPNYRLRHYGEPRYIYTPPPTVYAPPPGPPVIDFVFPFRFN